MGTSRRRWFSSDCAAVALGRSSPVGQETSNGPRLGQDGRGLGRVDGTHGFMFASGARRRVVYAYIPLFIAHARVRARRPDRVSERFVVQGNEARMQSSVSQPAHKTRPKPSSKTPPNRRRQTKRKQNPRWHINVTSKGQVLHEPK